MTPAEKECRIEWFRETLMAIADAAIRGEPVSLLVASARWQINQLGLFNADP